MPDFGCRVSRAVPSASTAASTAPEQSEHADEPAVYGVTRTVETDSSKDAYGRFDKLDDKDDRKCSIDEE